MRPALLRAALVVCAALVTGRAAAEPASARRGRVVLLVAAGQDELLREAATRLKAELGAAGFEVVQIDPGAPAPAAATVDLASAARGRSAVAAVRLDRSADGVGAALWLERDGGAEPATHTIAGQGAASPSVVAVRTVELLEATATRASAAGPPRPALPPGAAAPGAPPAARPPLLRGLGAEAGLFVLQGGGVGPAAGPFLRLSLGAPLASRGDEVVAARITLAGPAFAPALTGAAGALSVRQELAMAEAVFALGATGPVVPRLSAGIGAYHLHAEGDPKPPYVPASGDVWSVIGGTGMGLGFRLGARWTAVLDLQVLFAEPRPTLRLAGERLGAPGRPSFGGFLGVAAAL